MLTLRRQHARSPFPTQLALVQASGFCEILMVDVQAYMHAIDIRCAPELKARLQAWHQFLRTTSKQRRAQLRWLRAIHSTIISCRTGGFAFLFAEQAALRASASAPAEASSLIALVDL